jgi:phosphatidylserine/phosphatidylglycerophosphate/cardiolipin synthase-like enzyme
MVAVHALRPYIDDMRYTPRWRFRIFPALAVSLWILLACSFPAIAESPAGPSIRLFFSPNGGGTEAILSEIRHARAEVLVQAYSFTSAPIAKALLDARKRGVKVTVILDKSQRKASYSAADFLRNSGIATYIDGKHAIAHNKIMIIDRECVITGSFNFTKAAEEKNAENILVIRGDPDLTSKYIGNFDWHLRHSEAYQGREG